MKVTKFKVDGNELKMPSYAAGVEGLSDYVDTMIAAYDANTVNNKINALSNVYLGKTAKAVSATSADNATSAGKATNDALGRNISTTYYTTNTTVAKAVADKNGLDISEKYAQKTGAYANLKAGEATLASSATKATTDSAGNTINSTYVKSVARIASQAKLKIVYGDGHSLEVDTQDTTYQDATESRAGLLTAADKKKLNALSTDTSRASVSYAATAGKLANKATITITGGAIGGGLQNFDGSGTTTITLGNLNASCITGGIVPVTSGGTGQSALTNVTVGKANQLTTARNIAITGAVSGNANFDGSANVTISAANLNVNSASTGVLSTLRGGTGNQNGAALALANNITINGVQTNLAAGANIIWYGVCNTAAADEKKVVTIPNLKMPCADGTVIAVCFANVNTAQYPRLFVNNYGGGGGTGLLSDIVIRKYGGQIGNHTKVTTPAFTEYTNQTVLLKFNTIGTVKQGWEIIHQMPQCLATARSIALANGASGAVNFDGSANVTIPVSNLNMNYVTGGVLDAVHGGTGNSLGAATKLATPRSVNGTTFDGTANISFYGTCDTAADEQIKIVTITNPGYDSAQLSSVPQFFYVRFKYANTAKGMKLNVNGTGAKNVVRGSTYLSSQVLAGNYDVCEVLFHRLTENGAITNYRIIDTSAVSKITFTGAAKGEVEFAKLSQHSVKLAIQPNAFVFKTITAGDATFGNDLNNFTIPGFYRLNPIGQWKNRPSNTTASGTYYLQVLAKKATSGSSAFQQLFYYRTGSMWVRALPNGKAADGDGWKYISSTAVNTVTTISGGSADESDDDLTPDD